MPGSFEKQRSQKVQRIGGEKIDRMFRKMQHDWLRRNVSGRLGKGLESVPLWPEMPRLKIGEEVLYFDRYLF